MAMIAANPADPRLQQREEDIATASMLNGATQVAAEMAGQVPPSLTQRASDIARAEDAKALGFNTDLANRYAQAAIAAPVIQNMIAQAQTQQPQPEQQAPILTQGLMPGLSEGATYQAGYIPGQEQSPQEPPQTLTQMARQKALDIINAKNLYAQGEALGGEQGAKAMELAHKGAERARAELQQLGVDPAQYGLNGTYEEAVQGLGQNDMRAMNDVLNGSYAESSGDYYDRIYEYLRSQGVWKEYAAEEAAKQARAYQSNRVKALLNAYHNYGHDNTTNNPMGVQLLQMIADEDTGIANYYYQGYAGPLQEYADAKEQRNMATQHAYKKEDMAIGHQYDLENKDVDQQHRKEMAALNYQIQEAHANSDVQRKFWYQSQLLDLQQKYGIKENKNGITREKAEIARKAINDIDKQLQEGFNLTDEEKKQLQAKRAEYQSILDAYFIGGQSSGQQGSSGVDVNDYDSLRNAYQEMVNENVAREKANDPNNPPVPIERLNDWFLKMAGRDNPMAQNIIQNAVYGEDSGSSSSQSAQRPSTPQVVYLPATTSAENPGGYMDDYGTRGSIPLVETVRNAVSGIVQGARSGSSQTRAGEDALRRYGK